jgi:hypothetical protein
MGTSRTRNRSRLHTTKFSSTDLSLAQLFARSGNAPGSEAFIPMLWPLATPAANSRITNNAVTLGRFMKTFREVIKKCRFFDLPKVLYPVSKIFGRLNEV